MCKECYCTSGARQVKDQKKGSSLVQVTGQSLTLVSKIESIEKHQVLEKDCLDVVNKQWGAMLEAIEGLIKTLLSQAQEKPSLAFVQNLGMGYRLGNNPEHREGL